MRTGFTIPLQTEVAKYIKEKKGWPESFCTYYAEKFWNHYQASGWKLSSGNSVKDWKAAFNSQWQALKFKDDIDFFNKCMGAKIIEVRKDKNSGTQFDRLDELLAQYKAKSESIPFDSFADWYDLLKKEKLLRTFSKEEIERIKASYPGNNLKCRAACVQMTFVGYINTGLTFSHIMELRERLK